MASHAKILAFAGSSRSGSFNKKLIRLAVGAARDAGGTVTEIDLRDYPLPLYDGDLEAAEGLPTNGRKLKDLFLDHQALMIASPEYNSGTSALLKNTIDWVSRPVSGEPSLAAFIGKTAGIMSASPSPLGGLRGLVHLRMVLSNINVLVLPEQLTVPKANEAFDEGGQLKDPSQRERLGNITRRLVAVTASLAAR